MDKNWVVVSKIFYFYPYLGKIPNLTNIFQRGGSTTNQKTSDLPFENSGLYGIFLEK